MDLDSIKVKQILDASRTASIDDGLDRRRFPVEPLIEELLAGVDHAVASSLQDQSLKDLILKGEPPASDIPGRKTD